MKTKFMEHDISQLGVQCYDIPMPWECVKVGGYSYTIGYSSDGSCKFPKLNSNGLDGTCEDFRVNYEVLILMEIFQMTSSNLN